MGLTAEQKRALYEGGFVVLPGAVPRVLVDAACRAINASLGSEGIDPAQLVNFRSRSYCPELQAASVIIDLVRASPLWSHAESAIEPGKVGPVGRGQIALRFPSLEAPRAPGPHLDGMYTPTNGVPKGTISNFTALVGVFLSEIPRADMGNLTVWPGSHHIYQRHFREHGPAALLEGMPKVDLPEPRQVTGAPGDAVLCHYQLGHGIAPNTSPSAKR